MELTKKNYKPVIQSVINLLEFGVYFYSTSKDISGFPIDNEEEKKRGERILDKLKTLLVSREISNHEKDKDLIDETLKELAHSFVTAPKTFNFFKDIEEFFIQVKKPKNTEKIFSFISSSIQ